MRRFDERFDEKWREMTRFDEKWWEMMRLDEIWRNEEKFIRNDEKWQEKMRNGDKWRGSVWGDLNIKLYNVVQKNNLIK